MKTLLRSFLFLGIAGTASAQVYTPPAKKDPPAGTPTDSVTTVGRKQPEAKSPFGEEIPLLNPGEETITVAGITIPLGDNRFLQARFEKYLNQPEENSADAKEYRANIDGVLSELSPFREKGPNIKSAFQRLPAAAAFPADSRICFTLAEAVYTAMLAKRDTENLRKINRGLEDEKHKRIRDGDWKVRHDRDPKTGTTRPTSNGTGRPRNGNNGNGNNTNNNPRGGNGQSNNNNQQTTEAKSLGRGAQSLEYAEILRRIVEVETLKKKNTAQAELQVLQSKIQYQANMAMWMVQRRYQHVLMASRFYNQIWKDGDTALHLEKNSDISRMFTESVGVSPTVASLDSLASEAIQEVTKAVEAFEFLVEQGELHTASKRLMEAYLIGEYLSPITTLERSKKRKVQLYVRKLYELYGVMQARDYTKAKPLVAELREMATDFPSAKADSAIAGYTLASDLSIEKAKTHVLSGENDKASEEIAAAAELWPTNPKLEEFKSLVSKSSKIIVLRNDFDRLVSEQNFREIFRQKGPFAAALGEDQERSEILNTVVENIVQIDSTIRTAEELARRGNEFAAWEKLYTLRQQEEFSKDPELGREIEDLTASVSTFVNALKKASRFEERDQTGSAMTWYLRARQIFPGSDLAEEGFQRVLDEYLPENERAAARNSEEDSTPTYD